MNFSSFQKFIKNVPTFFNNEKVSEFQDPELLHDVLTLEVIFIVMAILALVLYHNIAISRRKKLKQKQKRIRKALIAMGKAKKDLALKPSSTFFLTLLSFTSLH